MEKLQQLRDRLKQSQEEAQRAVDLVEKARADVKEAEEEAEKERKRAEAREAASKLLQGVVETTKLPTSRRLKHAVYKTAKFWHELTGSHSIAPSFSTIIHLPRSLNENDLDTIFKFPEIFSNQSPPLATRLKLNVEYSLWFLLTLSTVQDSTLLLKYCILGLTVDIYNGDIVGMTDKAKSLEKLNQPEEPNLVVTRSPISELNSRKRQLVPEPSSPPRPGAVCWNTPQEPIQKENGQVALALPGQPRHSGASAHLPNNWTAFSPGRPEPLFHQGTSKEPCLPPIAPRKSPCTLSTLIRLQC
ncbi:hypothetical protein ACKVWC_000023 [Pyricularia oryzae]